MKGLLLRSWCVVFLLLCLVFYGIGDQKTKEYGPIKTVEIESLQSSKSPFTHSLVVFPKQLISVGDFSSFDYSDKFRSNIFGPEGGVFLELFNKRYFLTDHEFIFKVSRNIVFRNIRL